MKKLNIGVSTWASPPSDKLLSEYAENGIDFAEISIGFAENYDALDFSEARKAAEKNGIKYNSLHLPFYAEKFALDISSRSNELRSSTVKYHTELIKKAASIGIDKFVIHPCLETDLENARNERIKYAKESLSALADITAEYGAVIAVEDLPRQCLCNTTAEAEELISDDDRLRVCFDTNHLLTEKPEFFAKKLGKKIVTLHVSDYDAIDERHWLPGEGVIDWSLLYDTLLEVGYDGVWLYEIGFNSSSIDPEKANYPHTLGDFAKNANEIFSHSKLTATSKLK